MVKKIAVDFDGSIAHYVSGQYPELGEPLMPMVDFVKNQLQAGVEVVIFTARVSVPSEADIQRMLIQEWCEKHIGKRLEVTCIKTFDIEAFYDDRAVELIYNTGKIRKHEIRSKLDDAWGIAVGGH